MKQAWPQVRLSDVMSQVQRDEAPALGKNYRQIGVRLWGQGAYERESIDGSQTQYTKLFEAREGDIVVNKIWARNGSVAVVSDALNGSWGSTEFPLFEPDRTRLNPRWMHWITKAPWFWNACDEHAKGTSGKNRIKPDQFLGIEIPLPPLEVQQSIVARIDTVQQKLQAADELRASIDKEVASLLAVRFQETLTHAQWLSMSDVAPLVRREVAIESESNYSELGVRSFFKGAFIRRKVVGAEFTWQKLYQVNINDLIFSNIMAWEKGIALANAGHDKCVGNHRMLTCEANPILALSAYLHYYFTTDEGFAKVYAASPGTAARNRTLTADALMGLTVPVPTLAVQRQFVELKGALEKSAAKRTEQNATSEAILPSILNRFLG
jgi:type I restriction enzyme, S subunit